MVNAIDSQISAEIKAKLGDVAATAGQLGPIDDLLKQANSVFEKSLPNVRAAIETSRRLREKILQLLDKPKCEYDDKVLALWATLSRIPRDQRPLTRRLLSDKDRIALSSYVSRADWLALEEKSADRILSGLVIHAIVAHSSDDSHETMVALAPLRVAADRLKSNSAQLFAEAATFANAAVASSMVEFGKRNDVTLEAFGWQHVDTEYGARLRQTDD